MTISHSSTKFEISDEQAAFFHREGYVVIDGVIPHADLQPVIDEISDHIDRKARQLSAAGVLPELYESLPFEKRLVALTRHTDEVRRSLLDSNLRGPAIFNLIRHPHLLDVAEYFCGPELIAASVYRLRPKVPHHVKGEIPWHQDSGYFEPYCDKSLILTVWLPLIDAAAEHGCMWVIPRSHLGEVVTHVPHGRGTGLLKIPDELLAGQAVCVPVKKGGILLMTNRIMHASFANTSDIVRWSMDLRYQSAALPTNAFPLGVSEEAMNSPAGDVPVACYPPEADFLVRSLKYPEDVISTPDAFENLRSGHLPGLVTDRFGLHGYVAAQSDPLG